MTSHQAPSHSTLQFLRQEIKRARRKNDRDQDFVDIPSVQPLFTEAAIHQALGECGFLPNHRAIFTPRIQRECFPLFALLVYLEEAWLIKVFLEKDVVALPVEEGRFPYKAELRDGFKNVFLDEQWAFKPHFFHLGRFSRIHRHAIIPIIEKERLNEKDGSFGAISRIAIASSFHDTPHSQETIVARFIRKKIKPREGAEFNFEKERDYLGLLGEVQNPNIVKLLYSYTYRDQNYLIFPQASMDLGEFLRNTEQFGRFAKASTLYTALQGLTSALDDVHNLNLPDKFNGSDFCRIGYHHDIRPANVLVTPDSFLLADFGLSNMKDPAEQKSETEWKFGKGDYFAPECYKGHLAHGDVGRAIDIWALGCMLLEICTYMEDGASELKTFRRSRLSTFRPRWKTGFFFQDDHVKAAVLDRIQHLLAQPDNPALWNLAESIRAMLTIAPTERPSSSRVHLYLMHACTVALFFECRWSMSDFVTEVERHDIIQPSMLGNLELLRLKSWGEVLGLYTMDPEPLHLMERPGSNNRARTTAILNVQATLVRLKERFHDSITRLRNLDRAGDDKQSLATLENELSTYTMEQISSLFDSLPRSLKKKADHRFRECMGSDVVSSSHSYSSLSLAIRSPEVSHTQLDIPEVLEFEDTAPRIREGKRHIETQSMVTTKSETPEEHASNHSSLRSNWYVWDHDINVAIPATLFPRSDEENDRERPHRPSVLEAIGFNNAECPRNSSIEIPADELFSITKGFTIL
ncbi:kinase-like domain-containing protein [Lophiotrema nucula]|uniref:Kinase-like domain-containing protein n=1 Tax=Lophiotrema nucula TaxID=690887 RepID=A0A6A5ZH08_9PLEO|nr:kinase-like domain-containing protein [Lophiotrema nucula]